MFASFFCYQLLWRLVLIMPSHLLRPFLSCPDDTLDILAFLVPGDVDKEVRKRIKIYNSSYFSSWLVRYHHHHHVVLVARISPTLSRYSSLSFIASGRSSRQHPVSSHSCWMYIRAGRPTFARPCMGVHKSTSLMSSSLFLQQCPACLVRLTWVVNVIGGRWPYSWCL